MFRMFFHFYFFARRNRIFRLGNRISRAKYTFSRAEKTFSVKRNDFSRYEFWKIALRFL